MILAFFFEHDFCIVLVSLGISLWELDLLIVTLGLNKRLLNFTCLQLVITSAGFLTITNYHTVHSQVDLL